MNGNDPILEVRISFSSAMEKEYFATKAISVSSQNKIGRFDVLPQHINMITLVFKNLSIKKDNQEELFYEFERGLMEVSNNKVNIFLGI